VLYRARGFEARMACQRQRVYRYGRILIRVRRCRKYKKRTVPYGVLEYGNLGLVRCALEVGTLGTWNTVSN
jgi:hypothetical protein